MRYELWDKDFTCFMLRVIPVPKRNEGAACPHSHRRLVWLRNKGAEALLGETTRGCLFRETERARHLVMLESHPSLNSEGAAESSSSVTSCLNREPACLGSSAWESTGGAACRCVERKVP